jgi:hypothetical protein
MPVFLVIFAFFFWPSRNAFSEDVSGFLGLTVAFGVGFFIVAIVISLNYSDFVLICERFFKVNNCSLA